MLTHTKGICRALQTMGIDPKVGLEMGVYRGLNAMGLLGHYPDLHLWLVDSYCRFDDTLESWSNFDLAQAVEKTVYDTQQFHDRRKILIMNSEDAAQLIRDRSLDFVFIDGSHQYEHVKRDIELWEPKVRVGGLLMGHDYDGAGDRRKRFGVKRAVDEWGQKRGYKIGVWSGHVWCVRVSNRF